MKVTKYIVTLIDDAPPDVDEMRDSILDGWGFPRIFSEKPDLLKVELLEPDTE